MGRVRWADRGLHVEAAGGWPETERYWVGAARRGSVKVSPGALTLWVQLRGSSTIDARDGRFRLGRGDWIALERDACPMLQAGEDGVCIGIGLGLSAPSTGLDAAEDLGFVAGRGRASLSQLRTALRLWRDTARHGDATPLLRHLRDLQSPLWAGALRCPGRSLRRKRQVFARLQRARIYIDGHRHRVLRIQDLANLTNFSSWYFSKTFHALYGESPQAMGARARIEHAAHLLRTTPMMIGEVAVSSGFENCCSFARAFRAHHGMSASEYRGVGAKSGSTHP